MSQQAAAALAPLPFELVYDDGEPLETEWHTLEYPFLRELIGQAMAEQGRTDFYTGGHLLVGPVAIQDAMPGDSIEVRVLSVFPRIPYGTTGRSPGRGLKQVPENERPPANTLVVVSGLARPEWLVEIDAIAVIPEGGK